MHQKSLQLTFLIFASFCMFLAAANASSRPNIIYILADDMGYGDIQAMNPKSKVPTPNLDPLIAEGMNFTDAHSPSSVCTPTRYATLTGRYCWRSKLKRGVLNGYGEPLIEKDRPTVASHLKEAGYDTAVIGKWHLGLGFQKDSEGNWDWSKPLTHSPMDVGFMRSLVIPASLDFPPYVYIEGHSITGLPDRTQDAKKFPQFLRKGELGSNFSIVDCLDQLTAESAKHIRAKANRDRPFFLYMPLTAPHKPVYPHPRFHGKSGIGPYGDFVMQVDWTVGQIMKAVDEAGIKENTIIFYTSDNGSFMYRIDEPQQPDHTTDESIQAYSRENHTANGILRGTKADIWEAGHRVPYIVRWPKVIKAGSICKETICHTDLYATVANVANTKLPPATIAAQDSFDLSPLFQNQPKKFKRAPVIHHSGGAMFAIRHGDYKLILGNGSGGRQKPKGQRFGTPFQLYNLHEDPEESNDLYSQKPEIAAELESAMMRILADDQSRSVILKK
jgi:arylsulfatase A-like enzyme